MSALVPKPFGSGAKATFRFTFPTSDLLPDPKEALLRTDGGLTAAGCLSIVSLITWSMFLQSAFVDDCFLLSSIFEYIKRRIKTSAYNIIKYVDNYIIRTTVLII